MIIIIDIHKTYTVKQENLIYEFFLVGQNFEWKNLKILYYIFKIKSLVNFYEIVVLAFKY